MDRIDILIFVPTGTSIADKEDLKNAAQKVIKKRVKTLTTKTTPLKKIFPNRATQKDLHPAEVSSIYGFFEEKREELKNKSIKFILLHSPNEGKACAKGIKDLLENNSYLPKSDGCKCESELCELSDLDPKDASKFPNAVNKLTEIIKDRVTNFDGEVYLNITGGYKALLPYLIMIGMSLAKVSAFYLFEDSPKVIMLPSYPLAFDLLEWRDWRGLLLPFTMDVGLTPDQKGQLAKALEGTKVAGLIRQDPPYGLNEVGCLMAGLYEEERGVAVSEFGKGGLLLDRFTNKDYANYLNSKCIPRWRYLSVGDHIPETVEHGRGHVQRLLELAQQLLTATNLSLNDDQLFVLISSIWLHDLGHSGDYFQFEGENGLIQDNEDQNSTEEYKVSHSPELVRLYHSFLTYELLKTENGFLFPNGIPSDNSRVLLRSIQLASLYHRKDMPVKQNGIYANNVKVVKGLKQFESGKDVIDGFPLIAALLRFLDGAENQEERAGGEDYYDVVQWVLNRQIGSRKNEPDCKNGKDCLYKDISFKEKQKGHFKKHRWLQHIFFVSEQPSSVNSKGIYGANGDRIIGTYLIANPKAPDYCQKKLFKEVINPFLEEFLLVQEILLFRLVLFLVEPDSNGRVSVFLCSVRPENNKEPKEWAYELTNVPGR